MSSNLRDKAWLTGGTADIDQELDIRCQHFHGVFNGRKLNLGHKVEVEQEDSRPEEVNLLWCNLTVDWMV